MPTLATRLAFIVAVTGLLACASEEQMPGPEPGSPATPDDPSGAESPGEAPAFDTPIHPQSVGSTETEPPRPAQAGPVCDDSFSLERQSDIEALRACVTITGSLFVEPFDGIDLEPLSGLEEIGDSLFIGSNQKRGIPSLEGLRSLRSVGGMLDVNNTLVDDLSGFRSLERIGFDTPGDDRERTEGAGILHISNNTRLRDLSGLDRLSDFAALQLMRNGAIENLSGLALPESLSEIYFIGEEGLRSTAALAAVRRVGHLSVRFCEGLVELDGLQNLSELRELEVDQNPTLEFIADMPLLTEMDKVALFENPRLTTFTSLPALERTGELSIYSHAALAKLALPALTRVDRLVVAGNHALPAAEVDALVEQTNPGSAKVGRNLGQESPLSPCPWVEDGECDEDGRVPGLCATGSDSYDCTCHFECGQ